MAPEHTPVTQLSSQMDSKRKEMTLKAGNKRRKGLIKANHSQNSYFGEMCMNGACCVKDGVKRQIRQKRWMKTQGSGT